MFVGPCSRALHRNYRQPTKTIVLAVEGRVGTSNVEFRSRVDAAVCFNLVYGGPT